MTRSPASRLGWIALICLTTMLPLTAAGKKPIVTAWGGISFLPDQGSAAKYEFGSNDFAIIRAHRLPQIGLAIALPVGNIFQLGLEGWLIPGGQATMEDPSDLDTVVADTAGQMRAGLTAQTRLISGRRIEVAVQAGVGLAFLTGTGKQVLVSRLGSRTIIAPPEAKACATLFVGVRAEGALSRNLALVVSVRHAYLGVKPTSWSPAVLAGLAFRL